MSTSFLASPFPFASGRGVIETLPARGVISLRNGDIRRDCARFCDVDGVTSVDSASRNVGDICRVLRRRAAERRGSFLTAGVVSRGGSSEEKRGRFRVVAGGAGVMGSAGGEGDTITGGGGVIDGSRAGRGG